MKCLYLVFLCTIYFFTLSTRTSAETNHEEEVKVAVQLLQMDLEDKCTDFFNAQRQILFKKANARKDKIQIEKDIGLFIRKEAQELRRSYDISGLELDHDIQRPWEILLQMGDIELPEERWNELISFKNANEDLRDKLQVACFNITQKQKCSLNKSDILRILSTSNNSKELEYVWSSVQDFYSLNRKQFIDSLKLADKAAKVNGKENLKKYWEMLVEYPDAYQTATNLWNEIQPLYNKLHEFVKHRLTKHYPELYNLTNIPVYLLGSEFGTDWTNIAPLVSPHRYLYDEITSMLDFEKVGGKKVYEIAEKFIVNMGFNKAGDDFWKNSLFDRECPSQILTSCSDKFTSVFTCNSTRWSAYLNAHEDMTQVSLNNLNYPAVSYSGYRVSALDEALVSLSSILAVKNLPLVGIVPENVFLPQDDDQSDFNHNQLSALLLIALRVLPKLPYYILADTWRIQLLEEAENELTVNSTIDSWWAAREAYQKVEGKTNSEFDFLGDPYIISNKPYIGKFFGTLVQFQILEYFQNEVSDGINILTHMAQDENFKTLLKQRAVYTWPQVLNDNFYYDVSSDALLEYFKPLEQYMDSAPKEQVTQTVRPKTTTTTTPKTTTPDLTAITSITNDEPQIPSDSKDRKNEDMIIAPPRNNPPRVAVNPAKKVEPAQETAATSSVTATWIGALVGLGALSVIVIVVARKKCKRKPVVANRRHEV